MITIKELREFLTTLPSEFDEYTMVNGEVGLINGELRYRLDKPIISMTVDEDTKELVMMHQRGEDDDKE